MNRIILLAISTSLISIFSVSAIITSNPIFAQKSMQTYENEKYGFKIQYPFNWEFEESNYPEETQDIIGGFSPISSMGVSFAMSIQFLPSDTVLTLDQYAQQQLQKIKNYKLFNNDIHFNKLLSFDTSYTLGGKPAYKIVYENSHYTEYNDQVSYPKYIQVGTVIDSIEYRLIFYADGAYLYNQYLPIAEKIINSFEFM